MNRFGVANLQDNFIDSFLNYQYTVEPPVSDHPKCKDRVGAYGRWSFAGIKPQAASSEKTVQAYDPGP